MQDLLNIDLNELVTKEISEKISGLEKDSADLSTKSIKQQKEISLLKKELAAAQSTVWFMQYLRDRFSRITKGEMDSGGWFDSVQKNQFIFIKEVLATFFDINIEQNGWLCSRSEGRLHVFLAVNYYTHKQEVISLLKILKENCTQEEEFITGFKMPYDYSRAEVLHYVSNPKYNTNGAIYGISQYWMEYGAGKQNMPHDLIMRSPYIIEKDVFSTLISNIKKGIPDYHYLFALPMYNNHVSAEQIQELGECLLTTPTTILKYGHVSGFINKFITKFNKATLDYLYTLISKDNQYKIFHWQNFPVEYQKRFLSEMDVQSVLKTLHEYHCTWTTEDKASFLKEYLNKP